MDNFLLLGEVKKTVAGKRDNTATKTKNALVAQRVSVPELGQFRLLSQ
jgi:hypothetical protein